MTVYVKLPPNSGHLPVTDKFFNTRRCPLFRSFTVDLSQTFNIRILAILWLSALFGLRVLIIFKISFAKDLYVDCGLHVFFVRAMEVLLFSKKNS